MSFQGMSDLENLKILLSSMQVSDAVDKKRSNLENQEKKEKAALKLYKIEDTEEWKAAKKHGIEKFNNSYNVGLLQLVSFLVLAIIVLLIPLFTYSAVHDLILNKQPEIGVELLQAKTSLVLQNAYMFFATFLVICFLWGVLGLSKKSIINNPEMSITSLSTLGIYLIKAITIWVNGNGFWNVLYGIFWPIIDFFKVIGNLFIALFGNSSVEFIWTSWLISLLIGFNFFVAFFVHIEFLGDYLAKRMYPDEVSAVKEKWEKEHVVYVEALNKKKIEIKEANDKLIEEVTKKYKEKYDKLGGRAANNNLYIYRKNNFLAEGDYNYKTINSLIWCIENKYAYDIVTAKQWLQQQAHNQAVQRQLSSIINNQEQISKQVKEASEYSKAAYQTASDAKRIAEAPIDVDVTIRLD